MAPLELAGETLGQRHRNFNRLVAEATEHKSSEPIPINLGENDVDNLLKIDVACKNRNVEYILDVLKSEDMLYVSRAIKRSAWLVTDTQYSHIVNPHYLHMQLFPHMTSKARNKLMLHIRLHLRDEARVEEFYDYQKKKNLKESFKWLHHCPEASIKKEIEKHHGDMNISFIKRISERSIDILELYLSKCDYYKRNVLKATMFLINTNYDKYLDIVEKVDHYERPDFGVKFTEFLMKVCPQRVLDKFEIYSNKIHIATFAKLMQKDHIKDFLLKHVEDEKMRSWFSYDNLKHFIEHLPKEGRFDFIKKVFIEKGFKDEKIVADDGFARSMAKCCELSYDSPSSSANIYRWYRFAPFEIAFSDLKKLIRAESAPNERIAMMSVLLTCAGRNMQHVQTVLQYYNEKHINEPFKFKIQFVNLVLSKTNTHTYDEKTWSILNNIFCSMEVYIESENNVQSCIENIIMYKVLHNEKVSEIIEKKFIFNTLKSKRNKLTTDEKDKIFTYLYNSLISKADNNKVNGESELAQAVSRLQEILTLLIDWKKELLDYPYVIEKIQELIAIQKDNSWKCDMSSLYNKNKSWRKHLFEESLSLSPSEESCLNALKHEPALLVRHEDAAEALRRDDSVSLKRLLGKLRIYWTQSLAAEWVAAYRARLDQPGGHKALARGLCTLLPQQHLLELVKHYAPTDSKINWSEDDELVLSLRKHFAKNLYLSRPLPPPDSLLWFAQGDYLQFALPSLDATLYNISPARSREHIHKFLDAPVSLQKHGIRLAFTKLESEELKKIFSDIWKKTKNATIRAVLFKQTFDLLCKEKKPFMIDEIWELTSFFIDNLSHEENKTIFEIMGKVNDVPQSVKGKYSMKCYKFLKSLPAKANCESIIENLVYQFKDMLELLDADFVADILLDNLDKYFTTQRYNRDHLMSGYLLCCDDEDTQIQRFEKILVPLLERSFALWNVKVEGGYFVRKNVKDLLAQVCKDFNKYVCEKNKIFPLKMFAEIEKQLNQRLTIESNYVLLRYWKLAVNYVKLLEEHKCLLPPLREKLPPNTNSYRSEMDSIWNEVYLKISPDFANNSLLFLKDDIDSYFPSIYILYSDAVEQLFSNFELTQMVYLDILQSMLDSKEFIAGYLLVLSQLKLCYMHGDQETKKLKEIRKSIFSHPSTEVKLHYFMKYPDLEEEFEELNSV